MTKVFHLKIPDKLHDWLKQNVKNQSMNSFIVDLIKSHIEDLKPEQKEAPIEWTVTPNVRELLNVKEKPFIRDLNAESKDAFDWLFKYLFSHDVFCPNSLIIELRAQLNNEEVWKQFFEPALKLSSAEQFALYMESRKRAEWRRYGGDPEEIVWKSWTRSDVMSILNRNKPFTIKDVAAKLGLSYADAYNHIVPWLIRNKYTMESG